MVEKGWRASGCRRGTDVAGSVVDAVLGCAVGRAVGPGTARVVHDVVVVVARQGVFGVVLEVFSGCVRSCGY